MFLTELFTYFLLPTKSLVISGFRTLHVTTIQKVKKKNKVGNTNKNNNDSGDQREQYYNIV